MHEPAQDSTRASRPGRSAERAWHERRLAAGVLTFVLVVVPLLAGFAAATALGQLLADAGVDTLPRLAAVVLGAWAVHAVFLRLARRLLPLRALLRLSIVFPGKAPARWRVGLRASLTGNAATRLARLRGLGPDDAEAAAEVAVQLAGDLSRHDRLTSGHSERVRHLAAVVGREMNLSEYELGRLRWAALLHDIGKLTVDADVLNKDGRLNEREWDQILTHPDNGYDLIGPLRDWLGDWALGVRHHHERIDGRGYPAGLAGDDIPLSARIIAVVDAFDVMTSVRSYKRARSEDAARSELVSCAGSQFDPEVVRAFLASTVRTSVPVLGLVTGVPGFFANPAGGGVQIASSTPHIAAAAGAAAIVAGAQFAPLPDDARPMIPPAVVPAEIERSQPIGDVAPDAAVDGSDPGAPVPGEQRPGGSTGTAPRDQRPERGGVTPPREGDTPTDTGADRSGRTGTVPAGSGETPATGDGGSGTDGAPRRPAEVPPANPRGPAPAPSPAPRSEDAGGGEGEDREEDDGAATTAAANAPAGPPDPHPAPPPPSLPLPALSHPLADGDPVPGSGGNAPDGPPGRTANEGSGPER